MVCPPFFHFRRLRIACLALWISAGAGLAAAAATPPVKLTIAKSREPIELLEGWKLNVTVENTSTGTDVTLKELKWLLPPQLVATRGKPDTAGGNAAKVETWDAANALAQDEMLGPGQSMTFQLIMPDASDKVHWFLTPSILSWRYRELPVTVQLSYLEPLENDEEIKRGSVGETFDAEFKTPFRTMVYGGILGALLAMIFYYAYLRLGVVTGYFEKLKGAAPAPAGDKPAALALAKQIRAGLSAELAVTRPEHLRTAWHQMLTASITVVIVLLLLASGNMAILPVSVSVNDFVGAAFMGLIAHKIGKVTFDTIFGIEPRQDPPPPDSTPTPPPVDPALDAIPLTGTWDGPGKHLRVAWTASPNPKVTAYRLYQLATASQKPLEGTLVADRKPGEPMEYVAQADPTAATGPLFFALVVVSSDGTEVDGKAIELTSSAT